MIALAFGWFMTIGFAPPPPAAGHGNVTGSAYGNSEPYRSLLECFQHLQQDTNLGNPAVIDIRCERKRIK